MSPFATWLISWPSTASTSSRRIERKQARAHGDQRRVAARAGGEGVGRLGFEDGDLGHPDARGLRLVGDGLHQPGFRLVRGLADHVRPGRALGHPLRQQQRDEAAAHAEDRGVDQQGAMIEAHPLVVENAIHAEQPQHDAQNQQNRDVGRQEEEDALHGGPFRPRLCAEPQDGVPTGDTQAAARERPARPPAPPR